MIQDAGVDGWRNMLQLTVGCWLIASPFFLGFLSEPTASATTSCFGAAIALVSLLSIAKPLAWEEWANLALSAMLILSPWIFGFVTRSETATWNALASGTAMAVLAVNALGARRLVAPARSRTPTQPEL